MATVDEIINVEGMHCHGCEGLIKDILEEEEGVEFALASHKNGTVEVKYDPALIRIERIKALINQQEGYEVVEKEYKEAEK